MMRNGNKLLFNHQLTNHTPKTVKIISLVPDGGILSLLTQIRNDLIMYESIAKMKNIEDGVNYFNLPAEKHVGIGQALAHAREQVKNAKVEFITVVCSSTYLHPFNVTLGGPLHPFEQASNA